MSNAWSGIIVLLCRFCRIGRNRYYMKEPVILNTGPYKIEKD